jgi:hypothetical protein
VTDKYPGPWPLDRYACAARELGRFQGAYLTGTPVPDQPWLSRGWLRNFVEPSGPDVAALERLAGSDASPLERMLYPPSVVLEINRLWTERERFLTALDRLPQTFCHLDAFRRNLLHRAGPEGEEVVAIDWSYAGHGAVGQDLGQLVVASLQFFETVGIAPRDLDAACFAGYVAGLREAGGGLGGGRTPGTPGLHRRRGAAFQRWPPRPGLVAGLRPRSASGRGRPVRAIARGGGGGLG